MGWLTIVIATSESGEWEPKRNGWQDQSINNPVTLGRARSHLFFTQAWVLLASHPQRIAASKD